MKYDKIIHYCCGSYHLGSFGGVARYDYQLSLIFPDRVFIEGPKGKRILHKYLRRFKNPLVITDNHLSCDVPNNYDIFLVHHGCALTHAEREPTWGEPWKSLCSNGQRKMLDFRDHKNTIIISTSSFCSEEFDTYFGEKYRKFKRILIPHPSELEENHFKNFFNDKPVILGNWSTENKGSILVNNLKYQMKNFEFKKLSVSCNGKKFTEFNKRKQSIYLESDIFLQISLCEGNSYATLDALICGLVIVASDVGLFYKDVPENCFVKLDWKRNNDINYVKGKISEAWERREELSKNCRQWYLDNYRFIDWEKKMMELVN